MPTHPEESPRPFPISIPIPLPDQPNLRHLKDQAKALKKSGEAASLAEAQLSIARLYGFASWPKLKAHVDSLEETGKLKLAIDANNFEEVQRLVTRNPALHKAPIGYGKNGPLTWVAECRVPWEPPGPVRLAMAQWMIDHGSDVHQGGDGPLMRAALAGPRGTGRRDVARLRATFSRQREPDPGPAARAGKANLILPDQSRVWYTSSENAYPTPAGGPTEAKKGFFRKETNIFGRERLELDKFCSKTIYLGANIRIPMRLSWPLLQVT